MCMVTIYRGEQKEDTKLMEEVSGYEILLDTNRIRAWQMMGEEREFEIENNVRWSSRDDTLVI